MKGPMREILPVGLQTVALAWPAARELPTARLHVSRQSAPVRRDGERILIDIVGLTVHEIVLIDLPHDSPITQGKT